MGTFLNKPCIAVSHGALINQAATIEFQHRTITGVPFWLKRKNLFYVWQLVGNNT